MPIRAAIPFMTVNRLMAMTACYKLDINHTDIVMVSSPKVRTKIKVG